MGVKEDSEKEYVVTGAMITELIESSKAYGSEKMRGTFLGGSGARYKAAMQAILNSPYVGPEALLEELDQLHKALAKVTASIQGIRSGLHAKSK